MCVGSNLRRLFDLPHTRFKTIAIQSYYGSRITIPSELVTEVSALPDQRLSLLVSQQQSNLSDSDRICAVRGRELVVCVGTQNRAVSDGGAVRRTDKVTRGFLVFLGDASGDTVDIQCLVGIHRSRRAPLKDYRRDLQKIGIFSFASPWGRSSPPEHSESFCVSSPGITDTPRRCQTRASTGDASISM